MVARGIVHELKSLGLGKAVKREMSNSVNYSRKHDVLSTPYLKHNRQIKLPARAGLAKCIHLVGSIAIRQ